MHLIVVFIQKNAEVKMVINVNMFHSLVMAHCRERDDEMIVGDLSHMHVFTQGGSAQVSGPPLPLHLYAHRLQFVPSLSVS